MSIGERLQDLDATAMAVHVAEAADIHEDIEAQALARGELAQQLVVAAAMTGADGDDLVAPCLFQRGDLAGDLAIGVMAGAVKQRRGQIDFERLFVDQIDRAGRGFNRRVLHHRGRGFGQFDSGGQHVVIGRCVLDQRGRGLHLAGQQSFRSGAEQRGPGMRSRAAMR